MPQGHHAADCVMCVMTQRVHAMHSGTPNRQAACYPLRYPQIGSVVLERLDKP
jgi:hypothetical protein